jgi:hypothetical protein
MFEIIIATSADPKDEILRQPFELVADYLWSGLRIGTLDREYT